MKPTTMSSPVAPLFLVLCSLLVLTVQVQSSGVLFLPLSHSLSHSQNPNFTILHHLRASSLRSAARHRGRRQRLPRRAQEVPLPLSSGSDYTLSVSVGDPSSSGGPTTVSLYMDTGSDVVWFPCSPFECILCEGKPSYPFSSPPPQPPPGSHPVACGSPACSAAHSALSSSSDLCAVAACSLDDIETSSCTAPCPPFYYAYGDGSLVARLRRGPLSLPSSSFSSSTSTTPSSGAALRLRNFTFGCAHSALAEPVGVAGFGRGPLSLPAQLAALAPSLASRFSYCLVSHSFKPEPLLRPSPLILGRAESQPSRDPDRSAPFVYTPLLQNPKHPYFYSVALQAVSIGPNRMPARPGLAAVDENGNGGMVVDSGTTFTMLPDEMHSELVDEFDRQMSRAGFRRAADSEEQTGFRPCYHYDEREARRRVPALALHFAGNASVALPRRNYFLGFESGGGRVGCLMLMSGGGDDDGGPAGTLGNFQQQGFEVVYDLEVERVGFARRRCAALWDEMPRA